MTLPIIQSVKENNDDILAELGYDNDTKYEGALSPREARWEYIYTNNLWEKVYALKGQINESLVALMGRNGKDMDFAIPKDKYEIVVVRELIDSYKEAGWMVRLFDEITNDVKNLYVLRFTR